MFRVDTPTSVAAEPAQGAAGAEQHFTDGDPGSGTPATVPGADWFNRIQGELSNILVAAGIASDKDDSTQVAQAIAALIGVGTVASFALNTAPTGWLKANGAAISRATYARLFADIDTAFGIGDGATTFNLPDLRGEFIRGWDDSRGIDSGRGFGSAQDFAIENITGTFGYDVQSLTSAGAFTEIAGTDNGGSTAGTAGGGMSFDASNVVNTADETRPRNVALLICIKF